MLHTLIEALRHAGTFLITQRDDGAKNVHNFPPTLDKRPRKPQPLTVSRKDTTKSRSSRGVSNKNISRASDGSRGGTATARGRGEGVIKENYNGVGLSSAGVSGLSFGGEIHRTRRRPALRKERVEGLSQFARKTN